MLNTFQIYHDLKESMDDTAARKIATYLMMVHDEVRTLVTKEEFHELKEIVRDLGAAQTRTETAIRELATAHKKLSQQVGGLSDNFGGSIEDAACGMIYRRLTTKFGWKFGKMKRVWQLWGKVPEEVDVFAKVTDPKRPNVTIWLVGEAKFNLTLKEVQKFTKQIERARRNLIGEVFPICFCYRARPEVEEALQTAKIALLYSYGELILPGEKPSEENEFFD